MKQQPVTAYGRYSLSAIGHEEHTRFHIDPDVLMGFCGLYEAPAVEDVQSSWPSAPTRQPQTRYVLDVGA